MKITDTLSGKKDEFKPFGDVVTMYVCGINPYADSHIGHGMSYIIFDVVRRYLEFRGYKVKHVENVTDVEDNIINHANRQGISVKELTEKYTQRYFEDMDALNILRPHHTPKATETIPEIINMTKGLIDKGFAYAVGGNVYFRVGKLSDYGKLSKRSLKQMIAGARVEAVEEKEDPMDFNLWKAAKPGEPMWDSPWGKGRPGWHIECSAMSIKFLGEQIDIHGGGQDVVFPHHENEIAQSESFTGKKPFVKYWMHNGLLQMGAEKMSKSLGNLITIRDALKKYTADGLRVFILSSYYRSPLTYTEEALDAAQAGAARLARVALKESKGGMGVALDEKPYQQRFIDAMDDDFNTPQALAALFDLARDINRAEEAGMSVAKGCTTLRELGGVLGLDFKEKEEPPMDVAPLKKLAATIHEKAKAANVSGIAEGDIPGDTEAIMALLISVRKELRKARQFQLADEIRSSLNEIGIALEDTPQGTAWKRKR
ncbi:MAG: cysteine--tRNA ligase [Chloroflexi bacterium RBG_13_51_52]|nr:MAG: cysteine--tRNA ligase [Chloroflexi bacterium RBG_13_51_52]